MDTIYISNNGKGPLLAKIIARSNGRVKMVRWHEKLPNKLSCFELSEIYLNSVSCGWIVKF